MTTSIPEDPPPDDPRRPQVQYERLTQAFLDVCHAYGMSRERANEVSHDEASDFWMTYCRDNPEGIDWAFFTKYARGRVRNIVRGDRRLSKRENPLSDVQNEPAPTTEWNDPETRLKLKEINRIHDGAVASWNAAGRRPFVLSRAEFKYKQIAEFLGISVHAVRWHVAQRLAALRGVFLAAGYDPPRPQPGPAQRKPRKDT